MSADGDAVEIAPYDPTWPEAFAAAESELRTVLRSWVVAIEHIGDRDRYAALKYELAAAHRNDRSGYSDAKSDFIRGIEDQARSA